MTSPFETASSEAVDDSGVKRDRWGRYLLPDPISTSKKDKAWTRATTFAKSISDTYVLSQWGQRMAIKGLAMRPDLYALTAATPIDDRDKLNGIAEQCKEAAGAKASASLGTALHAFTEQVDRGEDVTVPAPWDKDVAAYTALLEAAGLETVPELIERIVIVERYGVAGTFDRIVRVTRDLSVKLPGSIKPMILHAGQLVVLDLKTGRDLSYGMNEIAIQLGLYAEADALWNRDTGQYEDMPVTNPYVALVVHLPVGQAKAELIAVDINQGRAAAELCAQVRQWRKVRALSAVVAVGEAEDPQIAEARASVARMEREGAPDEVLALAKVRPASWEERIDAATSKAELSVIWTEATAAGQWTAALAERGRQQLSKFATA